MEDASRTLHGDADMGGKQDLQRAKLSCSFSKYLYLVTASRRVLA